MSVGLIPLVAGVGDKLSRAVYLAPHLGNESLKFSYSFHLFQISEYEVDSFIIIIQVKLSCFLCCLVSFTFVAGVGGKLSRAAYLAPTLVLCFNFFNAHFTCFKLSVHEVLSFIIIIQVEFSCFLCRLASYPYLQGWGASCPGWFILPPT